MFGNLQKLIQSTKSRNLTIFVFLLLSASSLINVIQFKEINSKTRSNYQALYFHENDDVLKLGNMYTSVRGRWYPWINFSRLAPNSSVYIPKDSVFNDPDSIDSKLQSFGGVTEIYKIDIPTQKILIQLDPVDYIVFSIEDVLETRDPYFAYAMEHDDYILKPTSIRGMSSVEEPPIHEESEFVLIEWDGVNKPLGYSEDYSSSNTYALFIELDLLPKDIIAKIKGIE